MSNSEGIICEIVGAFCGAHKKLAVKKQVLKKCFLLCCNGKFFSVIIVNIVLLTINQFRVLVILIFTGCVLSELSKRSINTENYLKE